MNKFFLGVIPLVFLVGCSSDAPSPCLYKDQKLCKEREMLQMKADLYLTSVQKYNDCIWSQYRVGSGVCGKRPEWKDFK